MIFHDKAGLVLEDSHRYRVLVAGRRFGKTMLLVFECLRAAGEGPGEVWYIAPTYRQAKEIMWDALKAHTPPEWIVGKPNETELSVKLIFGTTIKLKGVDNPNSLRGKGLKAAFFDEYDFIDDQVWPTIIRPMLSTSQGRAMFVGTPDGFGNLHKHYLRGISGKPDDQDWAAWQFTTTEGGWVPIHEIDAARRDMDIRTFRQEYEASFESYEGRVYYAFDRNKNIISQAPEWLPKARLFAGMDFNITPMTSVVFAEYGDECVIIDCIEIPKSNTREMGAELRARFPRLIDVYPDPAGDSGSTKAQVGASDFTILREFGFRTISRPSTLSVKDGINAVNACLCSGDGKRRLFVLASCSPIIAMFDQYGYKKGTSQPDKASDHNHKADAVRYPIEYKFPIRGKAVSVEDF